MGPREGELVSERTCLSGGGRVNGKRFERSDELDTAQYKNLPSHEISFPQCMVHLSHGHDTHLQFLQGSNRLADKLKRGWSHHFRFRLKTSALQLYSVVASLHRLFTSHSRSSRPNASQLGSVAILRSAVRLPSPNPRRESSGSYYGHFRHEKR